MKKRIISKKAQRSFTSKRSAADILGRLTARDFSAIEDNRHSFRLIHKLATNAGHHAAAEAKARDLGTAYLLGNQLVKVFAKGETLAITPKFTRTSFYVKYKLGTILHAVKK